MTEYLQTGVYEGKRSYNAIQYFDNNDKPAFAVTNTAASLYPQNTFYPSTTFTWSMWVKNTSGKNSGGKWQDVINIRKNDNTHRCHDYSIISGGRNSNQVVMIYLRGFGLSWMPCSPWDNSRRDYGSTATTFRNTGASPGFEGSSKHWWFGQASWYHIVHTFQPAGSSYDSTLYINGKKCVTSQGNDRPHITNPTKFGSGTCAGQGGTQNCGGPYIADGSSGWRSNRVADMARVRYFPEEALTDTLVEALHQADKSAMPCLAGSETCMD